MEASLHENRSASGSKSTTVVAVLLETSSWAAMKDAEVSRTDHLRSIVNKLLVVLCRKFVLYKLSELSISSLDVISHCYIMLHFFLLSQQQEDSNE